MYLGDERVHSLEVYVGGYMLARKDLGLAMYTPADEEFVKSFELMLQRKSKRNLGIRWGGISLPSIHRPQTCGRSASYLLSSKVSTVAIESRRLRVSTHSFC